VIRFPLIAACLILVFHPAIGFGGDDVKIGVVLPLSGPISPTGAELRRGIEFAADEINRDGGIRSLGGAPLHVVYTDSRGLPETGISETERLIFRERVCALLGAFQSGVTMTTTEVAERYRVPYVVVVSVAPSITQRGFRYTFRPTETAEIDTQVQMDYLKWIADRTGLRPRTVALVGENSEWGETSIELTKRLLPPDLRVLLDERYSPGTADFTTLIQKLKQANPDIIFLASYVSDGILLTQTLAQHHVRAMAILTRGAEHGDPSYKQAVGDFGDYQTWMVPFHPAQSRRQPWMESILAEYRRRYGLEITPFAATAYADVYILKDALERAASRDPERIRVALASTRLTRGPAMLLPYPAIEFDAQGQNPHTTLPLIQTVRGTDYIVYPPELADPEFRPMFPMPEWGEFTSSSGAARWAQVLVNGLLNGGMYALFALGLSLVFGVMRVVNFAHGSLLMLSMFAAYGAWRVSRLSPYTVAPLVCAVLFLFGYWVQITFLNPLLKRDIGAVEPVSPLLLTLGLALVLDSAVMLLFGTEYRSVHAGQNRVLALGSVNIDVRKLVLLTVAIAAFAFLNWMLTRTRLGLSLRAAAQDREAASLQGIDIYRTYAVAFGMSAATVALAGCLLAPFYYIHSAVGLVFLINGFLVVVLGGMGSLGGTFAGALLVGIVEAIVAQQYSPNVAQAAVFLLFIGFLLLHPEGLSRRRRVA
jgi:branched-chain amino acid transport system substrate-binding protein